MCTVYANSQQDLKIGSEVINEENNIQKVNKWFSDCGLRTFYILKSFVELNFPLWIIFIKIYQKLKLGSFQST